MLSDFAYLPFLRFRMSNIKDELINSLINENGELSLDKIQKYFSLEINLQFRNKTGTTHLITPFRLCVEKDFQNVNLHQEWIDDVFSRTSITSYNRMRPLCPDMEKLRGILRLKNLYSTIRERISFSIQIRKCNSKQITCATDSQI